MSATKSYVPALLKGTKKTLQQIEEQGMKGIGKAKAFNRLHKPVCAFGWVVFHAGLLPQVEEMMKAKEESWNEGVADNFDILRALDLMTAKSSAIKAALEHVTNKNDDDKRITAEVVDALKELEVALKQYKQ